MDVAPGGRGYQPADTAAAAEHGVAILVDARNLDGLRQPNWLSGAVPESAS